MTGMQKYQACLESEAAAERVRAAADNAALLAKENRYASLHNSASDAMARTTEKFEEAVQAYKARQ